MLTSHLKSRYAFFSIGLITIVLTFLFLRLWRDDQQPEIAINVEPIPPEDPIPPEEPQPLRRHPLYKNVTRDPIPPIIEHFPLAANAKSPLDLPPIPSWNKPPSPHVPEETPLFIGFTRSWPLLQQAVVSYITAGWPPEDIYVVENTGTLNSNKHGRLTLQNPFYMDYRRLTEVFGVNVITTPTLLTFSQLQNFYLSEAVNKNQSYYFWSHMDVLVQSSEEERPYKSLYLRVVDTLRETLAPDFVNEEKFNGKWSLRFFAYDWLALVNVQTFVEIGGWDTMIPYYITDCDMHSRLNMAGYKAAIADAGLIYDLGESIPDLKVLYRRKPILAEDASSADEANSTHRSAEVFSEAYSTGMEEDSLGSLYWKDTQVELKAMVEEKVHGKLVRNSWQTRQTGGQGEPFYRDPDGFEQALQMTIELGGQIYAEKWGHKDCELRQAGLGAGDEWRVEHDW
ncbi:hypothetical protein MMC12_000511 [Toensbergia leucococca]|nr:hypothetical protein [Toensbergia leucococca]